jgi:hypothetical protein
MDIKSEDSTFISQETNLMPKYVQNLLSNLENFKKNCDNTDLIKIIENFEFLIGLFRYGGYGSNSKTFEDSIKSDKFINSLETCFKKLLNNEYEIIYLFINNQKNSMTNILTKFDSPEKFERELENLNIYLSMDKYQIKEDENIFDIEHNFKDQNIENMWKSYLEEYSENSNNKSKLNNINSDQDRLLNQQQIKVIDNFCYLFKVFYSKFKNIVANQSISSYPSLGDKNDIDRITKYLTEIYNLKEESSINTNDRLNNIDIAFKLILANILDEPSSSTSRKDNGAFNYEDEEDIDDEIYIPNRPKKNPISNQKNKNTNIFNFEKIKRNLIYFINIISKDNKYFNNDEIKSISDAISKYLSLQNNNLFIIQNSRINEFIKSSNFEDISLDNIKFQPISSKFYELKSLKNELLIKEYHFKKNLFDNSGNFLNPNSRQNIFRGKERYDPPYNWIGIGLNVIGKYEDDKWLNDISDKSEWAIAYRGIGTNISSNDVKKYLRYFIEKGLNIAKSSSKSKSNDKRRWKKVGEGIYMTPYIKIAEKYTQNITFNNKKYKVLLMAKVKIDKIREPKGTNFWVLNNEEIRIYRILFKSIE